jgi:signal transduction histidine kinase
MGILKLFAWLVAPTVRDEDRARQQFILQTVLVGTMILVSGAVIDAFIRTLHPENYVLNAETSLITVVIPFFFFLCLFMLSKRGHVWISAVGTLGVYFLGAAYTMSHWGAHTPQAVLIMAVVIVLSGIILGSFSLFITTLIVTLTTIIISLLHTKKLLHLDLRWASLGYDVIDAIFISLTLFVISLISWLSHREIRRSLQRARQSELALKKQRDLLEVKVAERTEELRQAQQQQLMQVYRFAEFGRIASGLFHDLTNPLAAVSLNLEQLTSPENESDNDTQISVIRAITGIKRLEEFVQAARRQIQQQEVLKPFSVSDELNYAVQVVQHKAQAAHVKIVLELEETPPLLGNHLKFNQIMTNLMANAIDAFKDVERPREKRRITVQVKTVDQLNDSPLPMLFISIHDWGQGIKPKVMPHIFKPLFTTKTTEEGTGLGLSIVKEIIERDFGGTIESTSSPSKGTLFVVKLPLRRERGQYESPINQQP